MERSHSANADWLLEHNDVIKGQSERPYSSATHYCLHVSAASQCTEFYRVVPSFQENLRWRSVEMEFSFLFQRPESIKMSTSLKSSLVRSYHLIIASGHQILWSKPFFFLKNNKSESSSSAELGDVFNWKKRRRRHRQKKNSEKRQPRRRLPSFAHFYRVSRRRRKETNNNNNHKKESIKVKKRNEAIMKWKKNGSDTTKKYKKTNQIKKKERRKRSAQSFAAIVAQRRPEAQGRHFSFSLSRPIDRRPFSGGWFFCKFFKTGTKKN